MELTNPITSYQYFISSPYFAGFNDLGSSDNELFLDIYVKLPDSLRNFISSDETATTISLAGIKYELEESQVSQLAQLIRELLLGNIFIKDFPSVVASKVKIEDSKSAEITNYIISQSFGPILEDVKRIQRNKFPDKVAQLQKESRPADLNRPMGQVRPPVLNIPPIKPATPQSPPLPKIESAVPKPMDQKMPGAITQPPPIAKPTDQPPPIKPVMPDMPKPVPTPPPLNRLSMPTPTPAPAPIPTVPAQNRPEPPKSLDGVRPAPATTPPPPPRPLTAAPQVQVPSLQKPLTMSGARPSGSMQFKIPDLGQTVTKENGANDPAKKSLEEELEKVANVIDLRSKDSS